MKINLGCGNKLLKDYLNVDIDEQKVPDGVDFRKGDIRDLKALGIEDASVDELLAVHVIEHFAIWELPGILGEWRRVLKPGGRLVVECPDIIKCAMNLLNMKTTAMPQLAVQYGLWGFYGDPGPRNEKNQHKWGFFAESLITALKLAAFADAVEEPAQFHAGPQRDLRVVATK